MGRGREADVVKMWKMMNCKGDVGDGWAGAKEFRPRPRASLLICLLVNFYSLNNSQRMPPDSIKISLD